MERKLIEKGPLLYLVTDRSLHPGIELIGLLEEAAAAGVDLIQIREKGLTDRQATLLVRDAVQRLKGYATRILVNDRFDIAEAGGADGVHLTSRSLSAEAVRRQARHDLLIGVSAHAPDEAVSAAAQGADFAVLGPVFDTPSKREFGPPLGLETLQAACQGNRLPILAIGGIDLSRVAAIREAGAAGIAAIRLFAAPGRLAEIVAKIRADWNRPEKRG